MEKADIRLGMNIDHVATLRNVRGEGYPDLIAAALLAVQNGADGITAHLREDRRHITDSDIFALMEVLTVPLNMEMAGTDEMVEIAIKAKPNAVCLVPEKRHELTTEGGLDLVANMTNLQSKISKLRDANILVSCFINADIKQIKAASDLQADIVEFHTGRYANLSGDAQKAELGKIKEGVQCAYSLGIECHAGHGLNYNNVREIAAIAEIKELNIGHFLISEAVFVGLGEAIVKMRNVMDEARK
jgi:pyridoxine 5-phosphate synthase